MRCFYHEDYYFPLPAEHPFPMDKFWRAEALIRASNFPSLSIHPIAPAPFESILRVHSADYLGRIRTGTLDHLAALKLGLPTPKPC